MPLYTSMFSSRVRTSPRPRSTRSRKTPPRSSPTMAGRSSRPRPGACEALAYRIAKNRKAHYVMLDVDAPPAAVAELERQTNINEDIIRFLTIRVDEHENGPSAMMRRSDRDRERGERGDRGGRPRSRRPRGVAGPRRPSGPRRTAELPPARRSRSGSLAMARAFFRRRKILPVLGQGRADHRL